jgi:rfaE bifunctional protein nucleotidyltransferase chain/domain
MAKRGVKKSSSDSGESMFLGSKGRYIQNKKQLVEVIAALRTIGAKIVLTQGTFDFIHIGHFLYLENAKKHGDVLIVGVDSDDKVRQRKGPDRPVVSEDERVQMLTHVRHVDIVALKKLKDPKWSLIKLVKPDVLIATKGTYNPAQLKQLKQFCNKVIILEPQATTSTTAKMRRLNIGLSQKMKQAITESINETFEKLIKDA